MGLLSSSVSLTRYTVHGKIKEPILETIAASLKKNAVPEIEDEVSDKSVGWTSFANHYKPDFSGSSYVYGSYLVFSMRIDKRTIPSGIVKKQLEKETAKQLEETGRSFLSRNEKQLLKDQIIHELSKRIPAAPHSYDLVWNLEKSYVLFFSTQKAANEELETLFARSFGQMLIRMFPYAHANLASDLLDSDRDLLSKLTPSKFSE